MSVSRVRRTQADRRERTRSALLEAAARRLSTHGYGHLVLERVAADAGYTRGALYHQFSGKDELALAVVEWVAQTWQDEVGRLVDEQDDPVDALVTLARAHAVYCRRDVARIMLTLRVELAGQEHPVARAVGDIIAGLEHDCAALVAEGRRRGSIPAGPPPEVLAAAYLAALEAVAIELAGRVPHDTEVAERTVRGVLGLPPTTRRAPGRRDTTRGTTEDPGRDEDDA